MIILYSTDKFFPAGYKEIEKFRSALLPTIELHNKAFEALRTSLLHKTSTIQ